ncbi:MAG: UDP-N-acetylmuramoyl-L-alanine--D-glutamate ligase [Minisyncoccia bacterium]
MKIGIVGFGREGKMALEYWGQKASEIFVYDKDATISLPSLCIPRLGNTYKDALIEDSANLDLIVRSPGIPLWDIEDKLQAPVTTVTKEFFDLCPCPIIGITGTKGKGTTASLIYEILKNDGKDAYLVGNIGTAALSVLQQLTKDSIVVYELSSFQLFDLHKSPHVAVCLLVTEDHLDWHKDLGQYQNAKSAIFKYQKPEDTAVWYTDNQVSTDLHLLSQANNKIPYGDHGVVTVKNNQFIYGNEVICETTTAKLPGKHNEQNICAAIAATWDIASKESIIKTIQTFASLPFHIETVATHKGITFVNDSFATNPTATEVAIASMHQETTLIVGGVDRGLHLEPFAQAIQRSPHIKNVLCFGQEGARIKETLSAHNISSQYIDGSLLDVFKHAIQITKEGGTILFSPGAPSFDMFKDYTERGNAFNTLVAQYTQDLL